MPTIERLIIQGDRLRKVPLQVRYGLILHPIMGPTLIDTGDTIETLRGPRSWQLRVYSKLFQPVLRDVGQPVEVLKRFDLTPADIRQVTITHFHHDHISGLRQFVNVKFIADGTAVHTIRESSAFGNYRLGVFPELLPDDFDWRFVDLRRLTVCPSAPGLPAGFDVFDDGSVIAIPLPGHMTSHFRLFFPQVKNPFLYATDIQWLRQAVMEDRLPGPHSRHGGCADVSCNGACLCLGWWHVCVMP